MRLDRAIRSADPALGRSAVGKLINGGGVRVNGRVVRLSSWEVLDTDRLEWERAAPDPSSVAATPDGPDAGWTWRREWVIADETDLVVLDKPAGLRAEHVRPSDDRPNLLALARGRFGSELVLAHRLDRDTSGLVIATRPGPIRAALDAAFKAHAVEKTYEAVVSQTGHLAERGEINARIGPAPKGRMQVVARGGDWARTRYVRAGDRVTLMPETGRSHQLRVHLEWQDAPIVGDRLYGGAPATRLYLHAAHIALPDGRSWRSPAPF